MNTRILYKLLGFFLMLSLCFSCQDDPQAGESIELRQLTRQNRGLELIQKVRRNPLGRKILALYKSTDGQTEQENEIQYNLHSHLINMGFTVEYWDIDAGITRAGKIAGCSSCYFLVQRCEYGRSGCIS